MKVIDYENMPAKFPVFQTITAFLACDYWGFPEWVIGVIVTLFCFIWVACIFRAIKQKKTKIF